MTLAMLHLPLEARGLMAAGREHGLVQDDWAADLGYLVHALLARLFQEEVPQPFDVQEPPDATVELGFSRLNVLAYTTRDARALLDHGNGSIDRSARDAVDWQRAAAKAMPRPAQGQELGFRVRTCPVIRVGKHHPTFRRGAEVDPYLSLVEREMAVREPNGAADDARRRVLKAALAAELPPREAVYRRWLDDRLAPAAAVVDARLTALRDARLWRRSAPGEGAAATMHKHSRRRGKGAVIGRREAVFEGRLRVTDEAAFQALLARGVGRHRAFGFGMLLLRPAVG